MCHEFHPFTFKKWFESTAYFERLTRLALIEISFPSTPRDVFTDFLDHSDISSLKKVILPIVEMDAFQWQVQSFLGQIVE